MAKPVNSELNDHTLLITIDRPEVLNAIDAEASELLGEAFHQANHEPDVWAVVLTGAGNRSFCAGADLKAIAVGELPYSQTHPEWGFAGVVTHPVDKPVIAAVNGLALGGGLELMLAADLIVGVRSARVGLPEVTKGIIASGGGLVRLPRQIPTKVALQLILTGETVTVEEMARWGLINEIVESDGDVVGRAMMLSSRITANAPLAVQASKRVALGLADDQVMGEERRWKLCEVEAVAVRQSQDAIEGPRAFMEKRVPEWRGK